MTPEDIQAGEDECHKRTKQQLSPVHHHNTAHKRSHCSDNKTLVHVPGAYYYEIVRPECVHYRTCDAEPRPAPKRKEQYVAAYEGREYAAYVTPRCSENAKGNYIGCRLEHICRLRRICEVAWHSREHRVRPVRVLTCLFVVLLRILAPVHGANGIILHYILSLKHRTEVNQCQHKKNKHCYNMRQCRFPIKILHIINHFLFPSIIPFSRLYMFSSYFSTV